MHTPATILIVDDGIIGRTTLESLLRESGHHLVYATNGIEALAMALQWLPDLILLDVMMPEMDGFEVCRRLRASAQFAEIPVIIVTALDDRESRLRGIEAGADDFISKPFDRVELRARVQTIVRLNRYRRLQAARAQFEWVVEQAGDGYLILDADDTIRYANPQARRYLVLPQDPYTPFTTTFQAAAQRSYHCEPEAAWTSWGQPEVIKVLRYLVLPENQATASFWLRVDRFVLPEQAGGGQLICLRDVTDEVATRRDMRRFHAMIQHKLRTPLSQMSTALEILSGQPEEHVAPMMRQVTDIAMRGVRRLRSEIEDILQYVQSPTMVDPGAELPLSAVRPMLTDLADSLSVSLIVQRWPTDAARIGLPITSRAIELALWELFENSKKFHPTHTPQIEVFIYMDAPERLRLRVRDDGVSLPPETLVHMLEPYYQAEREFTGQIEGMGLGLAMVSTVVWAAGGQCSVRNRASGTGIEVELLLPTVKLERMNGRETSMVLRSQEAI